MISASRSARSRGTGWYLQLGILVSVALASVYISMHRVMAFVLACSNVVQKEHIVVVKPEALVDSISQDDLETFA